jgi:hypothetical protein
LKYLEFIVCVCDCVFYLAVRRRKRIGWGEIVFI